MGVGIQTGSAFAHEQRNFGNVILHVGFRNEPAFEDEANALDLFVNWDTNGDGVCNDNNGQSDTCLDWELVDSVNITAAKVLYLETDQFTAPIRTQTLLKGELDQDFFDPTRYNIRFKPNLGGAYGFLLTGTIMKGSTVLTLTDEKFVCGNGKQSDHGFSCVGDILQPFPLGANSNYRDDKGNRGRGSEPHDTRHHKSSKKK